MRIDVARPEDAPALLGLHARVLAEDRWFIAGLAELPDTVDSMRARIRSFDSSPNSTFLVARDGPGPVGFLTLSGGGLRRITHVARLEVMVDAPHRGKGVGRALVAAGLQWARQNPMIRKVSLAVFDDNERAIALYQSLGFQEEGRRRGEYREPDGRLRGDVLMAATTDVR